MESRIGKPLPPDQSLFVYGRHAIRYWGVDAAPSCRMVQCGGLGLWIGLHTCLSEQTNALNWVKSPERFRSPRSH